MMGFRSEPLGPRRGELIQFTQLEGRPAGKPRNFSPQLVCKHVYMIGAGWWTNAGGRNLQLGGVREGLAGHYTRLGLLYVKLQA